MQSSIEYICAFGINNEKRIIPLFPGLNVITGDSKTGKSAVVEIIDYCLFSSRSTIPKGVISNFSEIFAITLQVKSKFISIARPSHKTGQDRETLHTSELMFLKLTRMMSVENFMKMAID